MPRPVQAGFEFINDHSLGLLYERKARETMLIRVLEDYQLFRQLHALCTENSSALPEEQLAQLRIRRAAVNQVIRSIEAYSQTRESAAGPH
jgi:hypothetical protein